MTRMVSRWGPIRFRAFFKHGQERSAKSHEIAPTRLVPLRVLSWIVLPGMEVFHPGDHSLGAAGRTFYSLWITLGILIGID
jgi:hypothetical protein